MKDLTELVFILDKSGSMSGKEEDVIGSFNSTIKEQKEKGYKTLVTTITFSDNHQIIHDRKSLKDIKKMTLKEYVPGGCTALIDTIGYAIEHISDIHKYVEEKPQRTLFVIITDGLENASHCYSSSQVKTMIEAKKEKKWEFLFLGANIDAVETAKNFGIDEDYAVNFAADEIGIRKSMKAVSNFASDFLNPMIADEQLEILASERTWRKEADEDFDKRTK